MSLISSYKDLIVALGDARQKTIIAEDESLSNKIDELEVMIIERMYAACDRTKQKAANKAA